MLDRGFLDVKTVRDLISGLGRRRLVTVDHDSKVADAMDLMKKYDIEQIPVLKNGEMSGAITQGGLFKRLMEDTGVKDMEVADIQEKELPVVDMDTPLERLSHYINKDNGAILTKDESGQYHILTKYDILNAFSKG